MKQQRAQAVVALGGGHGLSATLVGLRQLVDDLTVDELTAMVRPPIALMHMDGNPTRWP